MDNNTDSKNTQAKAGFSTYHITGIDTDADIGISARNTSVIGKETNQNINNADLKVGVSE